MHKICGVGESLVATKLGDLIEKQSNPTIATYAKVGQVHVRVTAQAKDAKEGQKLLKPVMDKIQGRFGVDIFTTDEKETLEEHVVRLLKKKDCKIAAAESCTGGLLAGRIINVPGTSDVMDTSMVTYSNKSKSKILGVKKTTLKEFGAVSKETAKEMAKGIAKLAKADVGIAVTGIAGPDGGTKKKPVGLVYIACSYKDKVRVVEYNFPGNRERVRERSVINALDLVRRCLNDQ